jgi:hypothetical protein
VSFKFLKIDVRSKLKMAPTNNGPNYDFDFDDDAYSSYIFTLLQEDARKTANQKKLTYKDTINGVIYSPHLRKRSLILFYVWMVILLIYLGVGMSISDNLKHLIDPYLTFLIAAILEFCSIITCHLL